MLQQESDGQGGRTVGEQHDGTPSSRRHVGRGLLIAGTILVLVAFFAPWANLYKIPSGLFPGEGLYSPFVVVWRSITNGAFLPATGVLLPFVVLLASSLALILRSPDVRQRKSLALIIITLALAILCIVATIFLITSLPAIEMFYPYYDVAIGFGAWVGLGAFLIEALSSLALAF